MTLSYTHTQKINPSADPIVVATVDKCLARCEKCPGYYMDSLTEKFRVNCTCSHHRIKYSDISPKIEAKGI